jgi:hypothetical protein
MFRRRPPQLAAVCGEEPPAHRRIVKVAASESFKERGAGGDHGEPYVEVPIALPPTARDPPRRPPCRSQTQTLTANRGRAKLERPYVQMPRHISRFRGTRRSAALW